jgi:hypothetical protein
MSNNIKNFYIRKKQLKQEVGQIEQDFKNLPNNKKIGLVSILVSNLVINNGNKKLSNSDKLPINQLNNKANLNLFDNAFSLIFLPFLKKYTINAIQHERYKNKFIGYALLYGLPILLKQFNQYMDKKHQS